MDARIEVRRFCDAHENATWLHCLTVARNDWWHTLRQARFMLYPPGHGMQSPKWFEALLVGTIPICLPSPAFVQLAASGWPMVIVQEATDSAPSIVSFTES